MAIFGDEDNMVERLVEIDARGFLDGTLTSRRVFQLTGPGTRVSPRYSWRFRVLTKGLKIVSRSGTWTFGGYYFLGIDTGLHWYRGQGLDYSS